MSAMFWNMIYTQQPDNRELLQHIQNDDIQALLRSDRLRVELAQPTPQIISYLASPQTLTQLISFLNSTDQGLSSSSNDIIVADIPQLMDQISNSNDLLFKLFQILLPYNTENMEYYTVEQLVNLPPSSRRVNLQSAENFCRAVYTLISKPQRKIKILNFLLQNTQILTWFSQSIQSAPVTETLHYIFKIDSIEQQEIQQQIIVNSQFIKQLFDLFLSQNSAFEELVHVAFICQSFLQSDVQFPIRKEIMENCLNILSNIQQITNSQAVKNFFTIVAVTIKYSIRHSILSETAQESLTYATFTTNIIDNLLKTIHQYLSLTSTPNQSNQENLLIVHSCGIICEIFKIQESVFESIKDKETLLLNRQFKPESAIQYMTENYQKPSNEQILPFVIGFSFIFQDIYQHLTDSTGFVFNAKFVNLVNGDKSPVKKINCSHLFGPNGEVCYGSVEAIIMKIIESGIIFDILQQSINNVENSIIHFTVLNIFNIIIDYVKISVPFAVEFLQSGILKMLNLNENPQEMKARISRQTCRTSLDALVVAILKKLGQNRANPDVQAILDVPEIKYLAEIFEVKNALGM